MPHLRRRSVITFTLLLFSCLQNASRAFLLHKNPVSHVHLLRTIQRNLHRGASYGTVQPSFVVKGLVEAQDASSMILISTAETATTATDALSSADIGVGIVLALLLAALASFLQGQSSSSFPNVVLWIRDIKDEQEEEKIKSMEAAQAQMDQEIKELLGEAGGTSNVSSNITATFELTLTNATSTAATTTVKNCNSTATKKVNWDEMRRPENYIWYSNPNLRANKNKKVKAKVTNDNRLAVLGLVLIFVPIFGAELFLALSRQFLCEYNGVSAIGDVLPWAQNLCAPIYKGGGGGIQ